MLDSSQCLYALQDRDSEDMTNESEKKEKKVLRTQDTHLKHLSPNDYHERHTSTYLPDTTFSSYSSFSSVSSLSVRKYNVSKIKHSLRVLPTRHSDELLRAVREEEEHSKDGKSVRSVREVESASVSISTNNTEVYRPHQETASDAKSSLQMSPTLRKDKLDVSRSSKMGSKELQLIKGNVEKKKHRADLLTGIKGVKGKLNRFFQSSQASRSSKKERDKQDRQNGAGCLASLSDEKKTERLKMLEVILATEDLRDSFTSCLLLRQERSSTEALLFLEAVDSFLETASDSLSISSLQPDQHKQIDFSCIEEPVLLSKLHLGKSIISTFIIPSSEANVSL